MQTREVRVSFRDVPEFRWWLGLREAAGSTEEADPRWASGRGWPRRYEPLWQRHIGPFGAAALFLPGLFIALALRSGYALLWYLVIPSISLFAFVGYLIYRRDPRVGRRRARAAARSEQIPSRLVDVFPGEPFLGEADVGAIAPLRGPRTVSFPEDRSLGNLFVRRQAARPGEPWKHLGEARGAMLVPEGNDLFLRVSPEGAADLSPLQLLGRDDLQALDLSGIPVSDAAIGPLADLRYLQWLSLSGTEVTDGSFVTLSRLRRLRVLRLAGTDISDSGLVHVPETGRLRTLDLTGTLVTDAGIASLRGQTGLRHLWLEGTAVTTLAVETLGGFLSLREARAARRPGDHHEQPAVVCIITFVWKDRPLLRALLGNITRRTYGFLILTTTRLAYVPVGKHGVREERSRWIWGKTLHLSWEASPGQDPGAALLEWAEFDVPLEQTRAVGAAGHQGSALSLSLDGPKGRPVRFFHVDVVGGHAALSVARMHDFARLVSLAKQEREWIVGMRPKPVYKEEVMPILLQSCPSFSGPWAQYQGEWEDGRPLLYPSLGEFAHHIVELAQSGDTLGLQAAFDVIERLHVEGEPDVQEAATVGLLEGIQNVALNRGLDPASFVSYLGPESARWWQELIEFWYGR